MVFSDSIFQEFPDTGISIGSYIGFYKGRPIDPWTYVSGPVTQSGAESEYNAACTSVMALAHFRMVNN